MDQKWHFTRKPIIGFLISRLSGLQKGEILNSLWDILCGRRNSFYSFFIIIIIIILIKIK